MGSVHTYFVPKRLNTGRQAAVSVLLTCIVLNVVCANQYFLPGKVYYTNNSTRACFGSMFQPASTQPKDVYSEWCRVYGSLADCLRQADFDFFAGHSFDYESFVRRGQYICKIFNDIADDVSCVNLEAIAGDCERVLEAALARNGSSALEEDCRAANALGICYQKKLHQSDACPSSVEHFFQKFTTLHIPNVCTIYEQPQTDTCANLGQHLLDSDDDDWCFADTRLVRECMEREQPFSAHPEDRVQAQHYNYTRYELYRNASCRLKKENDLSCRADHKDGLLKCSRNLGNSFHGLLEQNGNISGPELCQLYTTLMECNTRELASCKAGADQSNLLACASSPSSCPCPVALQTKSPENGAASMDPVRLLWISLCVLLFHVHR